MKKFINNILLVIFLSFTLAACQTTGAKQSHLKDQGKEKNNSSQPPSWVTKRSTAKYPASFFIIGTGVSNTSRDEADNAARMDLTKQVQVTISGLDVNLISETQGSLKKGATPSMKAETSSTVQTTVHMSLEGLMVDRRWFDKNKGLFYSLAVLDRGKAAAALRRQIQVESDIIKSNLTQGNLFKQDHKLGQALRHYLIVHQKRREIIPVLSRYDVIRGVFDDEINFEASIPSLNSLEDKIQSIASSLKIVEVSGNTQVGKSGKALKEELRGKLVYENGGESFPVANFPMKFEFEKGNGELVKEVTTDQNGFVAAKVLKVEPSSDRLNYISLRIDRSKLYAGLSTLPDSQLVANLNEVSALYTITLPQINDRRTVSRTWESGIKNLINQIINNLDEKKGLRVAVMDFSEIDGNDDLSISKILQEDIQTGLALAKDVNVINYSVQSADAPHAAIAAQLGADMYLTGMYRMETRGLVINARMVDISSSAIRSVAKILINREALHDSHLKEIKQSNETVLSQGNRLTPELELEKLINLENNSADFNVDVWTDKKEYRAGENVYFYFKADRDCYVTLFDVGTSGKMKVLFPNAIHRESFIQANKVYRIPGQNYGFDISVSGPVGIERIKVIASETPPPLSLTYDTETFYAYDERNISGARLFMDQLSRTSWTQDYVEIKLVR